MGSIGNFCGASMTSFLRRDSRGLKSDTNRTVRSRECFFPYNNLIDCCAHACRHQKPINATPSKLGSACGFVSVCSLEHKY